MTAPKVVPAYGLCPTCGGGGVQRDRSPDGFTVCENGHRTRSREWGKQEAPVTNTTTRDRLFEPITTADWHAKAQQLAEENEILRARCAQYEAVAKSAPKILEIPAGIGHDAITAIAFDVAPGKGKLIVQCWGDAWTCFFGAIGDRSLLQFIAEVDEDYLGSKLGANAGYAERIAKAVITAVRALAATTPEGDTNV